MNTTAGGGTTPVCFSCGRPILGYAVYGNSGEPYHYECTQPPKAENDSTLTAARQLMAERDEARADAERLAEVLGVRSCMFNYAASVNYCVLHRPDPDRCRSCRTLATYREKKEA